jgi:hypothetical protein
MPGTYTVTVTDANGLQRTQSGSIALALDNSLPQVQNCPADIVSNNPVVTWSAPTFTDNCGIVNVTSSHQPGASFPAGNTLVTYTAFDAAGNSVNCSFNVTVNIASTLIVQLTAIPANCFGEANGAINSFISGGTAPYVYQWSTNATSENISGLLAGSYSLTVTDAENQSVTQSIIVNEPLELTASTTGTNVSCFGNMDGTAQVQLTGGTAPYSYLWSTGATSQLISGLLAGNYTVSISDSNGCTSSASYQVAQPAQPLAATATGTDIGCTGGNTGTATVSATGGTAPYSYLWSNGATSTSITGLAAGSYNVVVTDANGCTSNAFYTVNATASLSIVGQVTPLQCNGTANGSINITVNGPAGDYSYSWRGPKGYKATTEDISGLGAGTYTVTVTATGGCTASASYTVAQSSAVLAITASHTDIQTCGGTGTITGNASGGTSPYQYSLNGGAWQNTNVFMGLAEAVYQLQSRDASGCATGVVSITIDDNGQDAYEPNNSINAAAPVSINNAVTARISPKNNDNDWYSFTTGSAGIYTLYFTHPFVTYNYAIYTRQGNKGVAVNPVTTTTGFKRYSLAANSVYYILVSGSVSNSCYQLSVAPGAAAAPIAVASKVNISVGPETEAASKLIVEAYPNPHQGRFTLKVMSPVSGLANIILFDVNGRVVKQQTVNLQKGENKIPFAGIKPQTIFYRVDQSGKKISGTISGMN